MSHPTSAYAPRRYPRQVLDLLGGSNGHKVPCAGYFPSGLTLERITAELGELDLPAAAWRPFLRDNARDVFGLDLVGP